MNTRVCEACGTEARCFVVEAIEELWYCRGCIRLALEQAAIALRARRRA